jgi:hypothetical protein
VLKSELYQFRPAPVMTDPTPLRVARELEIEIARDIVAGVMTCAPWFPWVPPVVIVKLLSIGKVGGPCLLAGAADEIVNKQVRAASWKSQ